MKYLVEVVRYDEQNNAHVLTKREISADTAINMMIDAEPATEITSSHSEVTVTSENIASVLNEAADRIDKAKTRKPVTCRNCGKTGHNVKTCPRLAPDKEEDDEPRQEPVEDVETPYMTARKRRKAAKKNEPDIEDRIANHVRQGFSLDELEIMYQGTPRSLIEIVYNNNKL